MRAAPPPAAGAQADRNDDGAKLEDAPEAPLPPTHHNGWLVRPALVADRREDLAHR